MENLLYWAGMLAVAVNALTGVLDAGRKNMDLIGVMMVGAATALGGGTVRDILLLRPVFWIGGQAYLLGVITGVVGGVLRDVLCNEVPLIFVRGELYASAAWMGALVLIGLQALALSPVIAAWAGMIAVLGVQPGCHGVSDHAAYLFGAQIGKTAAPAFAVVARRGGGSLPEVLYFQLQRSRLVPQIPESFRA